MLALGGVGTGLAWAQLVPWIAPVVAFRMGIAWFFRVRTNALNAAASRVGVEIGVVREGLELISRMTVHSAKLREIQRRVSEARAARSLRRLERWTNALTECEKPWLDLPSQALNLRTQICFEIEQWKACHGAELAGWLEAWGEFEALLAISGYAAEHPDDSFPEFVSGEAEFTARGLGHPLIPAQGCVRNDVTLDAANRFYVVSGSNMAGKSTLLRSIGLSVVLAYAGAPVRAASLRLTGVKLFASLSIVDSVLEGKSKFLAEVERVRRMLEAARGAPVLFLIDEILSGTNSRDRRIASEAVVRGLVGNGAIGALSTHDLALAEIAELPELHGSNVHMSARAGEDPMDFDYLLKPGVTRETNALAIVAMMGIF
jgi:DNA mismatch repair ATPase MutS